MWSHTTIQGSFYNLLMEYQVRITSTEIIVTGIASRMLISPHRFVLSQNIRSLGKIDSQIKTFFKHDNNISTFFPGTSSRNLPGLLEDGVGTAFIHNCHVNQARGESSNKMWSVLADQRHGMLRGDERYLDGHSRTSNILYQNISTPTSEFYECKHPFNPAHKPARGYIYFFT